MDTMQETHRFDRLGDSECPRMMSGMSESVEHAMGE